MLTIEELGISYGPVIQYKKLVEVLSAVEERRPRPNQQEWDAHWGTYDSPSSPRFLKRSSIYRYDGMFVTAAEDTEERFFTELKRRLFTKYLADVDVLAEFGCGTGHNLKQYGEMFPDKKMLAYDWSRAAIKLACNVQGVRAAAEFDMRKPSLTYFDREDVTNNFGILTCGSMEQLGEDFRPFLDFLCRTRPKVCVHVEPCVELYDESNLFDKTAAMYHRSRGYLGRWIEVVEKMGEVLLKCRTGFGCIYNEGYSVVVWRPS